MAATVAQPHIEETPKAPETPVQPEPTKLALTDNRPFEIQKFEFQQRCARLFSASGLFADIKGQSTEQSIAQAFVKIALGDSMGFNPAESMTGIDIIQGRVSVGSSLRAARMQRAEYSWDILQLDDKGCRLRMKYKGRPLMCEYVDSESGEASEVPAIVSFMAEDAARAGLIGKDNYKKNPRNMFFARAITNAQRWYAPGILGVDILSTEEAIDLEPLNGGQDNSLAGKAANVATRIKESYAAKPSSEGTASAASAPDPSEPLPSEPSQGPAEAQSSISDPEVQKRREELKQQVEHLRPRSRKQGGHLGAKEAPETQGVPLDFHEG